MWLWVAAKKCRQGRNLITWLESYLTHTFSHQLTPTRNGISSWAFGKVNKRPQGSIFWSYIFIITNKICLKNFCLELNKFKIRIIFLKIFYLCSQKFYSISYFLWTLYCPQKMSIRWESSYLTCVVHGLKPRIFFNVNNYYCRKRKWNFLKLKKIAQPKYFFLSAVQSNWWFQGDRAAILAEGYWWLS